MADNSIAENSTTKNTLLTIILILLILITGAMIFNFYGMKMHSDPSDIPKCVGADDLTLTLSARSKNSRDSNRSNGSNRSESAAQLLRERVGDYRDGSYNPEIQREMIKRAQEKVKREVQEFQKQKEQGQKPKESSKPTSEKVEKIEKMNGSVKSDKPENGKVKLCIYHMRGCGHCHDIMDTKQSNGLTKFQELQKVFEQKPNVEILDFQHGRDPEASKFGAFPVIMLVKDGSTMEYNRERSVEGMARFIIQNM